MAMRTPNKVQLHKKSKYLEVGFADQQFALSAEYLRVHSPSAEVKGHGPGQEVLQHGKQAVGIDKVVPMGNYAVRLEFDDGHDSGIYSWDYLYELGSNQESYWQDYLERLNKAGKSRDADVTVVKLMDP